MTLVRPAAIIISAAYSILGAVVVVMGVRVSRRGVRGIADPFVNLLSKTSYVGVDIDTFSCCDYTKVALLHTSKAYVYTATLLPQPPGV